MSILSLFNLQPRAVTVPAQAAPTPTGSNPPAPAPTAPTAAPAPAPAPAAPVSAYPHFQRTFSLEVSGSHVWQSFQNTVDDPHTGWSPGFRIGALPLLVNPRVAIEGLGICGNHQSVSRDLGEGVTSSATVSGLGWCPEVRINAVHNWLTFGIGGYLGWQHTSATAPMNGMGGLVYANNPVGLSVNQDSFRAGAYLSAAFDRNLGENVNLQVGTRFGTGRIFQSFTPDTPHRDASWPAIPADSVDYTVGLFARITLGRRAAPLARPDTAGSVTAPSVATPTPAPTTPTAVPTPAPTPTPAPAAPSTTTRTHIDPIVFTASSNRAANERALRTAIQTLANEIHLGDGLNTAPSSSGMSITLTYNQNNHGQIRVNHIGMADGTSYSQRGGNDFPTSIPEGLLQRMEGLIHEMVTHTPHGIPTYTGNRRNPIHMSIIRNSDGTISVS